MLVSTGHLTPLLWLFLKSCAGSGVYLQGRDGISRRTRRTTVGFDRSVEVSGVQLELAAKRVVVEIYHDHSQPLEC